MSIFRKSSRTFGKFRERDHNEFLWCGRKKNNSRFVTIHFFENHFSFIFQIFNSSHTLEKWKQKKHPKNLYVWHVTLVAANKVILIDIYQLLNITHHFMEIVRKKRKRQCIYVLV
jgi:hypothetical protein